MSARGPKTADQEWRALSQRAANEAAATAGRPMPWPNVWERVDPTKVPAWATDVELQASYDAFRALCRPRPRKQHTL